MSEVAVKGAAKHYGAIAALDGVDLTFADGEFFGLLGPSGSGKTTLLRSIAGFIELDAGEIRIDGTDISRIPVHQRNIGMVFQNYALFPHMSVAENVAFGLDVRNVPASEIKQRVGESLDLVRLSGLEGRRPKQLSGGQQQRVALARALVTRPKVLLLDEPLSALDKHLRQEMQVELRRIQRQIGITTIFVTHDQEEALTLSDRVAIFNKGQVVQAGQVTVRIAEDGELLVRGYNVMQGYLDDPDATAAVIDPDGWLHTGDLATIDENARVRIVGRKKDMFIVGGFNAYPAEIEGFLIEHPAVAQAAVIGTPDERMGQVGKAFVVLDDGAAELAESDLISWCKQRMAGYKVPRAIVFLEALPLGATGKVMKDRLE